MCINIANRMHKLIHICTFFWCTLSLLRFWRSMYMITQFWVTYSLQFLETVPNTQSKPTMPALLRVTRVWFFAIWKVFFFFFSNKSNFAWKKMSCINSKTSLKWAQRLNLQFLPHRKGTMTVEAQILLLEGEAQTSLNILQQEWSF